MAEHRNDEENIFGIEKSSQNEMKCSVFIIRPILEIVTANSNLGGRLELKHTE